MKSTTIPPLRFAPVGMTAIYRLRLQVPRLVSLHPSGWRHDMKTSQTSLERHPLRPATSPHRVDERRSNEIVPCRSVR